MAGYKELAGGLKPIRKGEIFWMITEIEWTNQNARNALEGRQGYVLWRAIRGGSACKGYLFQASGMWKGWDFTSWSIMWVCERAPQKRANRWILQLLKVDKTVYFCDWFLFKWQSIYSAVKRDAKFKTRCEKDVLFVNRRYTKGVPFSWKNGV